MVGTPDLEAVLMHLARLVVQRAAESDRQLNHVTSSSLSNLRCFTDRARAFWLAGLCLVALPLPVHAFSDPARFGKYPEEEGGLGGGGGRFFTGSPADGYGCSVCHKAK
jgi:hypothetical protein